jgi:alkylation response protein AidB-like acyl-CoA dehydrogenase
MDALDACFTGGHGVVEFKNLRVPAADVLGEIGKGFRYAQVRLAPARLTHCMRWLGQARRAHDVAVDYARRREAFGKPWRARRRGLHARRQRNGPADARLHIWHTAWLLDQGNAATSSRAAPRSSARRPNGASSTAACRSSAGAGDRRVGRDAHLLPTCARSASTTARAKSTAGAWRRRS